MKAIFAIIFCCIALETNAFHRIEEAYGKPADSLIFNAFAYNEYLGKVSLLDVQGLNADEAYLAGLGLKPTPFFDRLFAQYEENKPLMEMDAAQLTAHIACGMALLQEPSMALQIQGDRLLQHICDALEDGMAAERFDPEDEAVQAMVEMLKKERYLVKPPKPSDGEKAWKAIKTADFGYLGDRIYSRCIIDCGSGNCSNGCMGGYVGAGLLAIVLGSLVFKKIKR